MNPDNIRKCKKRQEGENQEYVNFVTDFLKQFGRCFLILIAVFMLVAVRKSVGTERNMGRVLAFSLFASLTMVTIYYADEYAFSNIMLGIGIYFGYELFRENAS